MNWSQIGKDIAKEAPLLGSILDSSTEAAADAARSILATALGIEETPAAVSQALDEDSDALAKVRETETAHQDKLIDLQISAAQNKLAAERHHNRLARRNRHAEHWAQWLWRPLNGLLFAPTILAIYVLLPLIGIPVPHVPVTVWEAWGALLGITAWHRGVKQRLEAGDGPSLGARIGQALGAMGRKRNET